MGLDGVRYEGYDSYHRKRNDSPRHSLDQNGPVAKPHAPEIEQRPRSEQLAPMPFEEITVGPSRPEQSVRYYVEDNRQDRRKSDDRIAGTSLEKPADQPVKEEKLQEDKNEIETCFDALYGVMMLRLQKKEISQGTAKAMEAISGFVSLLANYYDKEKRGELELMDKLIVDN